MSPIRRDILKAAGGVAALLTLPATCKAVESAVAAPAYDYRIDTIAAMLARPDGTRVSLVLVEGRSGISLGDVYNYGPSAGEQYTDNERVPLTDDEFAVVSDIMVDATRRALNAIANRTGVTA